MRKQKKDQQDKKLSSGFLSFLTKLDRYLLGLKLKKKKKCLAPPPQKKKINFNLFFLDIYLLQ